MLNEVFLNQYLIISALNLNDIQDKVLVMYHEFIIILHEEEKILVWQNK